MDEHATVGHSDLGDPSMHEPLLVYVGAAAVALAIVVCLWIVARRRTDSSTVSPSGSGAPQPQPQATAPAIPAEVPRFDLEAEDDLDVDPTKVNFKLSGVPPLKIVHDKEAEDDFPTQPHALFVVAATAQSDRGLRRKRNEDSVLVLEKHGLFVVADGMGGYHGGAIASKLAVASLEETFTAGNFGAHDLSLPRRAAELTFAVARANGLIHERADDEEALRGMGTTICAARFCGDKERLYIAHVGDSRAYRMRDGRLERMTTDHTFGELGATGPTAGLLSRAIGVAPTVPVDLVLGRPLPGDIYLLCSDGLNKMLPDSDIAEALKTHAQPETTARSLVDLANNRGGKDNISVIVMEVRRPADAA